jgi:hypothetical protein
MLSGRTHKNYFFMVVSATRLEVSTATVDVSAGDNVFGGLVESSSGVVVPVSSPQAVIMPATIRIASNFLI